MVAKNLSCTRALLLGTALIIGSTGMASAGQGVKSDPDFRDKLANSRISTFGWKTDFSRYCVPYGEILSGGVPRDGIPPIDNPKFVTTDDADQWIGAEEPVIALELNGDARAYPLQIMTWHEIANDVVGGVPITVSFCPLCNSAVVFDRRLDGVVYDFGVSGNLRNSDLIMWDRQTESWWQQLTGEGIVGTLAGKKLTLLASTTIAWSDFKAANPGGKVLSRDTGHFRQYGQNPYVGYDRIDQSPFLFDGKLDGRLKPMERVVAVTVGDADAAFPYSVLAKERAVTYELNGQAMVVFYKPGTRSALGARVIAQAEDVGAAAVFDPTLEGKRLSFRVEGDRIVDHETGSSWNMLGEATAGPLAGKKLGAIIHANHFWFAWAAFKPDTEIYRGTS